MIIREEKKAYFRMLAASWLLTHEIGLHSTSLLHIIEMQNIEIHSDIESLTKPFRFVHYYYHTVSMLKESFGLYWVRKRDPDLK